ncbi:GRB2-associated-binding protein 1 isoform X1 [Periophthalmus magnuspinnatus]|uniref:GRB2-associated-binding protein 1 isoform X1 n=2 Tax=Periophthalmus magnuspinnatus TaxID=409849 RepID=UPI00145AC6EF|nr:GRB2-associated-binding protein 1 isoform X1 [Periophthalmus magnuspinnatus]XP_055080390.1 GRB2-associated-binding protein 1 isoform X1 [Periophthalmus magnuspinnatus]XP_055080397.1 GRB2-associated-binding protein 1 isoform X1 [Periophthalmus magnuspinnatus]
MSGGEVVCSGWLRKSPPEKKLRRYAWKKRWFVLRNGRLTGDPDVLEYYKNDHAKKPIRVIDLNLCEQVDAGLTFNKKDLEHSFIFDIKTIDRVFYLVADTEEEMNKWVHSICEICGFNPTDDEAAKASSQSSTGQVVDTPPHPAHHGNIIGPAASVLSAIPPPYQPVHVPHLESQSSSEEPTEDYLWLVNCESKKPDPHRAHAKSTSSETDLNDNLPSHRTPTSTSSAKHSSHNGFFPQHHGPASASSIYDSPPSRGTSFSTDTGLYHLPRSYSQDTVLGPKSAPSPSTHPDSTESPEIYTFNTPSRKASMEMQMRNMSISYDFPTTPGSNCTYQVPRTMPSTGSEGGGDVVPPPRPPKPSLTSTSGPPPPPAERSPTDNYCVPRSASETDGNYCVPTATGNKALRSNTIGTVDCSRLRKDFGSQDCYDIPRSFPSDKSCSFDFNESFNSYFKNKGMMPLGSQSTEEVDQNYVPMSANSPSHHSGSLSEPIHEANYVPMTPSSMEFSSLGKQVPPPAHMGFRSSPKTPPRRPMMSDCQPPPVDRNLKPDRKGQSPKIIRAKGVGLERTDSQTVGEFPRGRRKGKPAPLEIKPLPEWEEPCTPVRSPVTRSFARDFPRFPMSTRPASVHSTASSTDSEECDDNYVPMVPPDEPNMKLVPPMTADGGSSPMSKPKGDKQVEYLDLDLESGTSTPPRKMKSNGAGMPASDERVDYVVVDRQRTQALKSTREAWNDGRQSTDTDTPNKGTK